MSKLSFADLQNQVIDLNRSNSEQWPPEWQLVWILEELGEVAKEIIKISKLGGRWSPEKNSYDLTSIKEELGDLMYGIISLAHNLNVNLLEALQVTIDKFSNREKNEIS